MNNDSRNAVLAMINGAWMCQAIALACRLDLPDRLAVAPQPVDRLAAETQVHAASLRRLLRALVSLGIAEELGDGNFALAPAGHHLRRDASASLRGWALLGGARVWDLWSDLAEGIRTGKSVRQRRRGLADYSELDRDRELAELFNRGMISVSQPVATALAKAVDFGEARLIVDVGGGAGHLLATLLKAWPQARGVVFDLAHASSIADETLRTAGVADRAHFACGSFFDAVPEGADAYVLKSVLHNWPDEPALRIVQSVSRAMGSDARVYLVERVMPERVSTSAADREAVRADLQMLLGCDGCERTEAQYRALLAAAGLRLQRRVALANDFFALEATRS